MGMYTEVFVNTDLKPNTPKQVIDVLRAMCHLDDSAECLDGKPQRWPYMFNNGSYYTPLTQCASLTYDEIAGHWSIIAKGDIKNYEDEIEQFFEFIKPWCSTEFIGYMRYEEDREPTLVYSDK